MQTKTIMTACAALLGSAGILLTFLPRESLEFAQFPVDATAVLAAQLAGAVYFGIAMIDWMARGSTIGGIYNRPIAIGNFAHFFIGGLALVKAALKSPPSWLVWTAAVIFVLFAVSFAKLLISHPGQDSRMEA